MSSQDLPWLKISEDLANSYNFIAYGAVLENVYSENENLSVKLLTPLVAPIQRDKDSKIFDFSISEYDYNGSSISEQGIVMNGGAYGHFPVSFRKESKDGLEFRYVSSPVGAGLGYIPSAFALICPSFYNLVNPGFSVPYELSAADDKLDNMVLKSYEGRVKKQSLGKGKWRWKIDKGGVTTFGVIMTNLLRWIGDPKFEGKKTIADFVKVMRVRGITPSGEIDEIYKSNFIAKYLDVYVMNEAQKVCQDAKALGQLVIKESKVNKIYTLISQLRGYDRMPSFTRFSLLKDGMMEEYLKGFPKDPSILDRDGFVRAYYVAGFVQSRIVRPYIVAVLRAVIKDYFSNDPKNLTYYLGLLGDGSVSSIKKLYDSGITSRLYTHLFGMMEEFCNRFENQGTSLSKTLDMGSEFLEEKLGLRFKGTQDLNREAVIRRVIGALFDPTGEKVTFKYMKKGVLHVRHVGWREYASALDTPKGRTRPPSILSMISSRLALIETTALLVDRVIKDQGNFLHKYTYWSKKDLELCYDEYEDFNYDSVHKLLEFQRDRFGLKHRR